MDTGHARAVSVDDPAQHYPDVGKPSGILFDDGFVLTTQMIEILDEIKRNVTNSNWGVAKMIQSHSVAQSAEKVECMICNETPPTFFLCESCKIFVLCVPCFIQQMSDKLESHEEGFSMQFRECPGCRRVFKNVGRRYDHK